MAVGAAAAVHSLGRCSHGRSLDLGPNLADRRTLAVAAGAVGPAPAPAGRTSAAAGARAWTAAPLASVARASGDLAHRPWGGVAVGWVAIAGVGALCRQ